MKNLLLPLIIIFFLSNVHAQNFEWFIKNGNNGYNIATSLTLQESNIIHAGWLNDTLIFDLDTLRSNGGADGYLSVMDSAGNYIKSINWGGQSFDATDFIGSTNNSLILSGTTTSPNYKLLGNQYQKTSASQDVFIAKLNDSLTNVEWIINDYNNGSMNYNTSMAIEDTIINISGFYGKFETRTYNTNGILLWKEEFQTSNSVLSTLDSTGIYTVVDSFHVQLVNGTQQGEFYKHKLMKYDKFGNLIDETDIINYPTPILSNNFNIQSIITDETGNILISGNFEGVITFDNVNYNAGADKKGFLAKFDNTLSPKWFNIIGDSLISYTEDVKITSDSYYVGWVERLSHNGDAPYYHLSKYDKFGNLITDFKLSSTNTIVGYSLVVKDNDIYVSGLFRGDININGTICQSTGVFDIFIFKINSTSLTNNQELNIDNSDVKIYPNPVQEQLIIDGPNDLKQISIFTVNGQKLKTYHNINSNHFEIDTSFLKQGVYFVLIGKNGSYYTKILKK